jgi:hypothetical protein
MAALTGFEDIYLSNNLMDTAPEIKPHGAKVSSTATLKIGIETIVVTAVIFIAILTWFEVLRSLFDNIFSDEPNYGATWVRVLYSFLVTIIAIIVIKLFGKNSFKGNDK